MLKQFIVACALALALAGSAGAASVRQLLLDEIIDTSAVAFQGTCTANRTEREAKTNLIVTYTTFDVNDVLKGKLNATHTIKQIGGVMPTGESSFVVHGVPTFVVGEEYVVFLAGVSPSGFSSPIALEQGKFTVQQNAKGKTVANGSDFREITARMPNVVVPASDAPTRQLGLDEFKQLARAHAAGVR